MTHLVVITLTNAEHRALLELAARAGITIEEWVHRAAVDVASGLSDARSPRRDEGAKVRPWGSTPPLVVCGHCRMATRPVKTCDNCERALV